jgi:poly-gamma-glutamate capsule biosynthesis protein CapA/YwtB (metallophosphatase superfamily)
MRSFCALLVVCIAEAVGLALLLVDGPASAPAAAAPPARHAAPARAAPLPTLTVALGGDVALAGDPQPALLSALHPYLRGTVLAMANLEGTLAGGGAARCAASAVDGCFVFRASPEWAQTLRRAGFTAMSVANNHALDFGASAQAETLAALRSARVASTGLPGRVAYVRAGGVKVALIAAAPYPWAQSLLDAAGTQALVRRAARRADVVVVYAHAGAEGADAFHVTGADEYYRGERRGNVRVFAHAMIAAGADLFFASGPHVLRGMEWFRGRLIAYSLGNLATSHTLSTTGSLGESALLRLTLDAKGRFVAGSVVPLRLDAWGRPTLDRSGAGVRRIRTLSRQDFGADAAEIRPGGTLTPPRR